MTENIRQGNSITLKDRVDNRRKEIPLILQHSCILFYLSAFSYLHLKHLTTVNLYGMQQMVTQYVVNIMFKDD